MLLPGSLDAVVVRSFERPDALKEHCLLSLNMFELSRQSVQNVQRDLIRLTQQ